MERVILHFLRLLRTWNEENITVPRFRSTLYECFTISELGAFLGDC